MVPCYKLKSMTTRTNGPTVAEKALGTYIEDYECVKTSSTHLDEYNGVFGKTPEFPGGVYHYVVTVGAEDVYKESGVFPYLFGPSYYYGVPNVGAKRNL